MLIIKDNVYAYSGTLPQVKLSTKPMDLRMPPTEIELMAAGQMGGPLYPTNFIVDVKRREIINMSFGVAIQQWNRHNYADAVKLLLAHIEEYPTVLGRQKPAFMSAVTRNIMGVMPMPKSGSGG
jgi:hypothetical protein